MNLREACRLGLLCGLQTMDEAWLNVQLHSLNLFVYEHMDDVLSSLEEKFSRYNPDTKILDVFPDLEDEVKQEEQEMIDTASKTEEINI